MKKEYIFPVVDIININTLDILAGSPDDDDEFDIPITGPGSGNGQARCRNDYGQDSDFGSLW